MQKLFDLDLFIENSERILRQMETPIHVLIGNNNMAGGCQCFPLDWYEKKKMGNTPAMTPSQMKRLRSSGKYILARLRGVI